MRPGSEVAAYRYSTWLSISSAATTLCKSTSIWINGPIPYFVAGHQTMPACDAPD